MSDNATSTVTPDLPAWVEQLRPHQVTAIDEIVDAFEHGSQCVFLDAPTGSGKTLIAEMVRRRLDTRGIYVCSDKALQRQFKRDFPEAAVLQGRNNYPTQHNPSLTAEDCTASNPKDPCAWCDSATSCPYGVAKAAALTAPVACLNSAYYLTAANHAKLFSPEPFVVLDEADTLEQALLSFVEYKVPTWATARIGTVPSKAARKTTIVRWMEDAARKIALDVRNHGSDLDPKRVRNMEAFVRHTAYVAEQLKRDIDSGAEHDDNGKWIRVYDDARLTLHLKPVQVASHGSTYLWRHGKRFLAMSGTLISTAELADTLGLPYEYDTVTVPMTFPVEHRPIVVAPIADMNRNAGDRDYAAMAYAIQQVANLHDSRILVHTVSRERSEKLIHHLDLLGGVGKRPIIEYATAKQRDDALDRYLARPGSILFAQSMDRGVDLPGDACRVQVIAKIPFPSLGDRRTSARLHLPNGQNWYTVQTVRTIVQMTGRGVRSADDWASTYIFDAQFRNLWKQRALFPSWWREAVDTGRDIRQFLNRG
jgi:Rad3-related DNA helicase